MVVEEVAQWTSHGGGRGSTVDESWWWKRYVAQIDFGVNVSGLSHGNRRGM